jgi:sialate O-acetylesterase
MRRQNLIASVFALQLAWGGAAVAGELRVAAPFTDNAVLQREASVPIWGQSDPGERITIQLDATSAEAVADDAGHWQASLASGSARSGVKLVVSGEHGASASFTNIAVGDVWLCSGQSNMEFEASKQSNAQNVIAMSEDPALRLLLVPRQRSTTPTADFAKPASWALAKPASVSDFSAVCHAMGQAMRSRAPEVPIGLISASWGGSRIEDWLSTAALKALGGYEGELNQLVAHARDPEPAERYFTRQRNEWLDRIAKMRPSAPPIPVPSLRNGWEGWDIPALSTFDGVGVYQIDLTVDAAALHHARALRLGKIDDMDRTTLNGRWLGTTASWDVNRSYALPAGLLHKGHNNIAVMVVDTGGGGGFYGADPRGLELDDGSIIPFDTGSKFTPLAKLDEAQPVPVAPWNGGGGLATLDQGMIAPLGNYRVKGFAWYQGEANVPRAPLYVAQLEALIADWRNRMGGAEFLIVQLAAFGQYSSEPRPSSWAALREAQRQITLRDPATRLIPTMDIGDPYDIHPTNKREVGRRLALASIADRAGQITIKRNAGSLSVELPSPHQLVGGARTPTGFELCDANDICRFTDVRLTAPELIEILVKPTDRKLRYLWANSAFTSLFDKSGIPLPPFEATIPATAD